MEDAKKKEKIVAKNAKLMQFEIEKQRKLPEHIKEKIHTNIFQNLIAAIIILAYLLAIDITYRVCEAEVFEYYMKYYALGIILGTVFVFEIAYRKNSKKYTLIGVELLCCGILSLYIPYIYIHTSSQFRNIVMILPAFLTVYYLIKSILIYKAKQFKYTSNLSDVKEIVKEDNKESYLDEKSRKVYKDKLEEEALIRQEIRNEQIIRKTNKELNKKNKASNNTNNIKNVNKSNNNTRNDTSIKHKKKR